MAISVGDQIPNINFTIMTNEGPKPLGYSELFEGKRVARFFMFNYIITITRN